MNLARSPAGAARTITVYHRDFPRRRADYNLSVSRDVTLRFRKRYRWRAGRRVGSRPESWKEVGRTDGRPEDGRNPGGRTEPGSMDGGAGGRTELGRTDASPEGWTGAREDGRARKDGREPDLG